ncbi:MAG: sodium:calcium antiporter [Pseudomonadota bacterium]
MAWDLGDRPLAVLALLFIVSGAVVWVAGALLARLVDTLADRTGIGKAFAGMLLLGGITSLPEVATVATASATGSPSLALNNLLGSASINVALLALADFLYGRAALTSMVARPATLLQGVLGMTLMTGVAIACATGDVEIPYLGVGAASLVLGLGCVHALRIAARFERAHVWTVVEPPELIEEPLDPDRRPTWIVVALIVGAAASILAAGSVLSLAGDGIAAATGLGDSFVGFTLVGFATSLPEMSSVFAAMKLRRYELAIGDIFGTNLFNIQLILLADIVGRGPPVLAGAGRFEIIAAALAVAMTGLFVIGLLERRDRTILCMGRDSALVLIAFAGGVAMLARIA